MTRFDGSQLLLSFESGQEGNFVLQVARSQPEYFEPGPGRETYPVILPRPFQATALMDDGGWRRRIRKGWSERALGYQMFGQFPPPLGAELTSAGTSLNRCRVAIVSRGSGVDDVPWEWLNWGPGESDLLAVNDRIRFIRLVPCRYALPQLTVIPPLRILTVTTNPKDERLLNPAVERRLIVGAIKDHPAYEIRDLVEPGLEKLEEALKWSPHIVHYVGHAGINNQSGAIILHDEHNGTRWVTAAELSQLLPVSVKLLCLSTCVTAENYQIGGLVKLAHGPTDLPLPTMIVNQYAIEADTASTFWGEFYPALIDHAGDIVEAFHRGRRKTYATPAGAGNWSWASFSLVVRDATGVPLRFDHPAVDPQQRFIAEVQALWSTRLANSLATVTSTLTSDLRRTVEGSLDVEEKRMEFFRKEVEKY